MKRNNDEKLESPGKKIYISQIHFEFKLKAMNQAKKVWNFFI